MIIKKIQNKSGNGEYKILPAGALPPLPDWTQKYWRRRKKTIFGQNNQKDWINEERFHTYVGVGGGTIPNFFWPGWF